MDDLDTLFTTLSNDSTWEKPPQRSETVNPLLEDDIDAFTIRKMGEVVNAGVDAINQLKDVVISGQNPDEIASLAELMSSTSRTFEALNKFALLKRKAVYDRELKQIDLAGKKEIAGLLPGNTTNITNNIGVRATREEIIRQMIDAPSIHNLTIEECTVVPDGEPLNTEET